MWDGRDVRVELVVWSGKWTLTSANEPREHADDGNERDELGDAPEDEEDAGHGHCVGRGVVRGMYP